MSVLTRIKSFVELFGPLLDGETVSGPDGNFLRIVTPALDLVRAYFRGEVIGLENIPKDKALIVANHNAGITSLEPLVLGLEWYHHTNGKDCLYFLAHDMMVSLPILGNMLIKAGAIRASHKAADKALQAGKKVMVFPGGNYESFRPFSQRHLVDFGKRVGYVKLALRNQAPIVPVLCFGGHETFFVISRGETLAQLIGVKKYLRSDAFPVFLGLPWIIGLGPIFHLPLPSKLIVEIAEPISLSNYSLDAINDHETLLEISNTVQERIQQMMDLHAAKRRWPILG